MACEECEERIGHSFDKNPFISMGPGRVSDDAFICPLCGQRWWRYNNVYCLWSPIDDDATWENVLSGCKSPVAIGNPSRNVY